MHSPLDDVDLHQSMSAEESLERILTAQRRLTHLRLISAGLLGRRVAGPPIIVVFEGFDASGKGGTIRRVTAALDPRHVRVVPITVPTAEEHSHHFLWRFQATLPARGEMTIYDRSWYGRLLAERVEHLISAEELTRSADEIVEFERALANDGAIIVKFFLHVSASEQLRRFQSREADPLKRWKLTPEDWANRDLRDDYVAAVSDMVRTTDHPHARWRLVAAESKHFARVAVIESLDDAIEKGLRHAGLDVPESRGDDYLGGS